MLFYELGRHIHIVDLIFHQSQDISVVMSTILGWVGAADGGVFWLFAAAAKGAATVERWRPELERLPLGGGAAACGVSASWSLGFWLSGRPPSAVRHGREPAANTVRVVVQALASLVCVSGSLRATRRRTGRRLRNPALGLEPDDPAGRGAGLAARRTRPGAACLPDERARAGRCALLRWPGCGFRRRPGCVTATSTWRARRCMCAARSRPPATGRSRSCPAWATRSTAGPPSRKAAGLYREEGPFLVGRHGSAWSSQYVQQLVARVGERAGLPRRLTPHGLRRTLAAIC